MPIATPTATAATAAEDRNPTGNWPVIRRLLGYAWRYRRTCLAVLGLQVILLALGLAGLSFVGLGIDYLRTQVDPAAPAPRWPLGWAPPLDWTAASVVGAIALAIVAFAGVRMGLNYLYATSVARLVHEQILLALRTEVYEKLQRLSFRFFDRHGSGALINRTIGDVSAVRVFVEGVVIQSVILVLSLAVYLAYMIALSPSLTLVCLASTPLLWFLAVKFARQMRPLYLRNRELMDRLFLHLGESIQGVQTIKGFAREREASSDFSAANDAVRDHQRGIFRRVSVFSPTIGYLSQLNIALLLGYGGWLVVRHEFPLGAGLIVFTSLLQQFSNQVSRVADIANSVMQCLAGARRVFEILDAPEEITTPARARRLPRLRGAVEFRQVTFAYDGASRPALDDVSFTVEPGMCVAVVGVTGAGKTTLLSLVPRFYDPQRGTVLVDGHDVRECDLHDLRRQIGLVFQESFLFSHTVGANIAFGQPEATRQQLERAAHIASAHEFISALPRGYETPLGEFGVDLSGGQRQRLAIARAVLLEPPILLMDDPTAAIDPETEHEILEAMDRAIAGRTTFIVAHRLSTLQRADRILVLEHGRIVQTGTHEQLLRVKGPYRRAAKLQLSDVPPLAA